MKISEDENTITLPILKAVEHYGCDGCYFNDWDNSDTCEKVACLARERKDGKKVIFVEVQNEEKT
jgi:hypothetical protein